MNVFTMHGDNDRLLVGIGLSEENVANLKEDHPILYAGQKINIPFDLFMYWSPDNRVASYIEKLKQFGFTLPTAPPDGMTEGGGMTWKRN